MSDLLKVKVGGSSYLCKWTPPKIPAEYKRVEYVYNTNRGAIIIVPNNPNYVMLNQIGTNYRIEVGLKIVSFLDDHGEGFHVTYSNGVAHTLFGLNSRYGSTTMRFVVQNGIEAIAKSGLAQASDCTFVFDNNKFIFNDVEYTLPTYSPPSYNYSSMIIFGNSFKYKGFKYIKAYSPSNELVIDLEPVVRKADGVPGYYDTVTQQFVTAYDTGLVAGPDA